MTQWSQAPEGNRAGEASVGSYAALGFMYDFVLVGPGENFPRSKGLGNWMMIHAKRQ